MIILGIDPGKTTGLAVLQTTPPRVLYADQCVGGELTDYIDRTSADRVVYERMQSYGRGANGDFIDAAEIGGYCRHALGAVPMTRPETIRALGLTGKGIGKSAVWAEVVRILGSDAAGKRCPKRNNKAHDDMRWDSTGRVLDACPVCGGGGFERAPGPLAMFRGQPHAKDALTIAVAFALREGLL